VYGRESTVLLNQHIIFLLTAAFQMLVEGF
jgi:hypothetical protein